MARLYLDHDVSLRLALPLREAGHDVITARDAQLVHATDDEHLLAAAQQRCVLLTHNRKDYVLLHDAWRRWPGAWGVTAPAHTGILVLDHRPERELAAAVGAILTSRAPAPLDGTLYWWRHRAGWHRQAPGRRWLPLA